MFFSDKDFKIRPRLLFHANVFKRMPASRYLFAIGLLGNISLKEQDFEVYPLLGYKKVQKELFCGRKQAGFPFFRLEAWIGCRVPRSHFFRLTSRASLKF